MVIAAPGSTSVRLGISVSRKIGNAVCRNRIKRWLREYFRIHRSEFSAVTDLSVVVKPGAALLDHADIDQQLQEALRRLRVYADA